MCEVDRAAGQPGPRADRTDGGSTAGWRSRPRSRTSLRVLSSLPADVRLVRGGAPAFSGREGRDAGPSCPAYPRSGPHRPPRTRNCCERPQAPALGALAFVDAGDEIRDRLDGRADAACLIGYDRQERDGRCRSRRARPTGRPGRERLEHCSVEDFLDPVVQLGTKVARIDALLRPPDNLGQVRLGQEPEGRAGAVVESRPNSARNFWRAASTKLISSWGPMTE